MVGLWRDTLPVNTWNIGASLLSFTNNMEPLFVSPSYTVSISSTLPTTLSKGEDEPEPDTINEPEISTVWRNVLT